MKTPPRTGLRRLWYVASWRARYWWLDTRAGLVTQLLVSLAFVVVGCWSAWMSIRRAIDATPAAGDPVHAAFDWWVYAIMFVVSIIVSLALAPKIKGAPPQKVQVPVVEDGAVIRRIYGPVWIKDPIMLAVKPTGTVAIRKKAGKSWNLKTKWQTVGYHYEYIFQFGLCRGMLDSVLAIRVGDKPAWSGQLTSSGIVSVNKPNLWGGEDAEGGIVGDFEFAFGNPDQAPSSYLAANVAPHQSAYRWRPYATFRGGRWGNSPYPKPPAFLVSRILNGWDGGECWYPEKAEVPLVDVDGQRSILVAIDDVWKYRVEPPSSTADYSAMNYDDSDWDSGPGGFGNYGPGWDTPPANTIIPYELGEHVWIRRTFGPVPPGRVLVIVVWADNVGRLWFNGEEVTLTPVRPYRFEARIPASGMGGTNVAAVQVTDLSVSYIYAAMELWSEPVGLVGMNPAHVLYDSLTAREMDGESRALINEPSWRAAADRLYNESFGIGTEFIAGQETIEQFQQRLCDLAGARMSVDPTTGEWHLDLIRSDVPGDLLVITDDDVLEFEEQPSVLDEAVNQVTARWTDVLNDEVRATAPVQALGAIQAFGAVNAEVLECPEVLAESLALRLAARNLDARATPLKRYALKVTRVAYRARPGQKARLQLPKRGIADMVVVLGDISRGTLRSGGIALTAVQDVAGMPDTTYVVSEPGAAPVTPTEVAQPALAQLTFETPYRDLVQVVPDAERAALSVAGGYTSTVALPIGSGDDYLLHTKVGGGAFEQIAAADWCPSATVVEGNQYADAGGGWERTTFTLAAGYALDEVQVGMAALWGQEMVRVDAIDAEADPPTVTLARGCGDTVPQDHAAGERIWFYDGFEAMDPYERAAGDVVTAATQSRTASDLLPLAAASTSSVTLQSRQARPYPPGRLQLNGESQPLEVVPPLVLTWAHRDRLGQGERLVDAFLDEDLGPEAGVTYTVRNLDMATGIELYREDGIDEVTHEIPVEFTTAANIVEVFAVRGELESWQRARLRFVAGFEIEGEIGKVIAAGHEYIVELTTSGGTGAITWSIEEGELPDGWDLDGEALGGIATTPGDYQFLIQAMDELGVFSRRWVTVKIAIAAVYMPGTGSHGSTTFTDLTGKTWTKVGSPEISTADPDFPDGAINFPSAGGAALRATSSDFQFGYDDVTMDVVTKPASASRNRNLLSWHPNPPTNSTTWTLYAASNSRWYLYSWNHSNNILTGDTTVATTAWRRVSRSKGVWRLAKDGVVQGTYYDNREFTHDGFSIGGNLVSDAYGYAGLVSEIRVVRGIGLASVPLAPTSRFPVLVEGDVGRAKAYWRILITGVKHTINTHAALAELQFRSIPGGADLATGGTPIADSQWGASYLPSNAFDGDPSTRWLSLSSRVPNAWIGYEFPAPVVVNAVLIRSIDTGDAGANEPMAFTVQSSDDGEVWFDEWSVTVATDWGNSEAREFVRH